MLINIRNDWFFFPTLLGLGRAYIRQKSRGGHLASLFLRAGFRWTAVRLCWWQVSFWVEVSLYLVFSNHIHFPLAQPSFQQLRLSSQNLYAGIERGAQETAEHLLPWGLAHTRTCPHNGVSTAIAAEPPARNVQCGGRRFFLENRKLGWQKYSSVSVAASGHWFACTVTSAREGDLFHAPSHRVIEL